MQCRRCGFENMPGLTLCGRCGSPLTAVASIDVNPPRAGWTRRFRPIKYGYNRLCGGIVSNFVETAVVRCSRAVFNVVGSFVWVVLSALPGLAHLLQRRFRPLRWAWPGWLLALVAGPLLYGELIAYGFMGMAIALHAWIAYDASKLRDIFYSMGGRLIILLAIFACAAGGIYYQIPLPEFRGVKMSTDWPPLELEEGDSLIVVPIEPSQPLRRGELVLYQARDGYIGAIYSVGGEVPGILLGFPHEEIKIEESRMQVTTPLGETASYLLPGELAIPDASFTVGAEQYFCYPLSMSVTDVRYRRNDADGLAIIQLVGLPGRVDVGWRMLMVYNTFFDRRMLEPLALNPAKPAEN